MNVVPGQGVDFGAVGRTLLLALGLYLIAALLVWLQARILNVTVQRTMVALRSDVEDKVHRMPLSYFDSRQRGELLSRVTNDIDNIATSLSMTISQLLTSVLTVFAVLGDDADDLAAADTADRADGAVVAVGDPGDRTAFATIVRRAVGQHRPAQRPHRGDVQRFHGGQDVRSPCPRAGAVPRVQRRRLSGQLWGAVHFGPGVAGDDLHRQPELCRGGGGRRAAGGDGTDHAGQHPGVHPVRAPVQPAADPGRGDVQHPAVRGGQCGAGFRSARRRGGVTGPARRTAVVRMGKAHGGASSSSTSISATCPAPR